MPVKIQLLPTGRQNESWDFKLSQAAVSLWIWFWCYWPYSLGILVAVMLVGQVVRWALT